MTPELLIFLIWYADTLLAAIGLIWHGFRWAHWWRTYRRLHAEGVNGAVQAEARRFVENEVFRIGLKAALFVMVATVAAQRLWTFPGTPPVVGGWVNAGGVLVILLWLTYWTKKDGAR